MTTAVMMTVVAGAASHAAASSARRLMQNRMNLFRRFVSLAVGMIPDDPWLQDLFTPAILYR